MTDTPTQPVEHHGGQPLDKGLKVGAIGLISAIVIGVASTAPGYSLAASLGFMTDASGAQAPAILLVAFVPMLFIAAAYYYLNRADPDCGTTFTWVTRAIGPKTGWIGGWSIIIADLLVMPSLAGITGSYFFLLFGWDGPANNKWWVLLVGVIFIFLMTLICVIGIELNARTQFFLLAAELIVLMAFAGVALYKVLAGDLPGSVDPSLSWLNPFDLKDTSALADGMVIAIFLYWGWDTAVTVNEETKDSRRTPGRAAIISTHRARADVPDRGHRCTGGERPGVPHRELRRRAQRHGQPGAQLTVRQVPDHRRALVRRRVDPDHHPARGPQRAVDGRTPRGPRVVRSHQPELPVAGQRHVVLRHPRHRLVRGTAGAQRRRARRVDRPRSAWPSPSTTRSPGSPASSTSASRSSRASRTSCSSGWRRCWARRSSRGSSFKAGSDFYKDTESYGELFGIGLSFVVGIGLLLLGIPFMLLWWMKAPEFFRRKRDPFPRPEPDGTGPPAPPISEHGPIRDDVPLDQVFGAGGDDGGTSDGR